MIILTDLINSIYKKKKKFMTYLIYRINITNNNYSASKDINISQHKTFSIHLIVWIVSLAIWLV